MSKLRDLTGQKFNSLTVLERVSANRSHQAVWLCKCDCGILKTISMDHLTRKRQPVKSCGCQARKLGPRHHQWNGAGEISGGWWYNHVAREKDQNTREKVPLEIDVNYAWNLFLKQERKCALTGRTLYISNTALYNTASIDRIDSSKGYIDGNIQWVHKDINFMKRTYDLKYFIDSCTEIAIYKNLEFLKEEILKGTIVNAL